MDVAVTLFFLAFCTELSFGNICNIAVAYERSSAMWITGHRPKYCIEVSGHRQLGG